MGRKRCLAVLLAVCCFGSLLLFALPGYGKAPRLGGEYVYLDAKGREDLNYRLSLRHDGTWSAQGLINDRSVFLKGSYRVDADILVLSHATLGLATYLVKGNELILLGARMFPGEGAEVWVRKKTFPRKERRLRKCRGGNMPLTLRG
jgi:hypothetical protein